MRHITKLLPAVVVVSLFVAACGSSSSSSSSSPSASQTSGGGAAKVVKTASISSLGASVLVDSQGLTLYHLSAEQHGKWICTSAACTQLWHPLVASSATPSGSVGSIGTIKRPDGTTQVTYKGMPLYTFAKDTKAGEAGGQGFKDVGVWTAVTAKGAAISKPAATTPAPASSSSGGGGYAY
jgi:predicted lipoprotein with Yx(FWY)xxD motif